MPPQRRKSNLALYLEAQRAADAAPAQPQVSDLRRYLAMGARGAGALMGLTPVTGAIGGALGETAGELLEETPLSPARIAGEAGVGLLGGGLVSRIGRLAGKPLRAAIEGAMLSGAAPVVRSVVEQQELPDPSEIALSAGLGAGTAGGLTALMGRLGAKVGPAPPTILRGAEMFGEKYGTPTVEGAARIPYTRQATALESPRVQRIVAKEETAAAKAAAAQEKADLIADRQAAITTAIEEGRLTRGRPAVSESVSAPDVEGVGTLSMRTPLKPPKKTTKAPIVNDLDPTLATPQAPRVTLEESRALLAARLAHRTDPTTPLGRMFGTAAKAPEAAEVKFAGWTPAEAGVAPQPYFTLPGGSTTIGEEAVISKGLQVPQYPPFNPEEAAGAVAAKADRIGEMFGRKVPESTPMAREAFLADQQAQIAAQQAATEPAITTPLAKLLNVLPEENLPTQMGNYAIPPNPSAHLLRPGVSTVDLATEKAQQYAPGARITQIKKLLMPEGKGELEKAIRQRSHIDERLAGKPYVPPAEYAPGAPTAARAVEAAVPEVAPVAAASDDWMKQVEAEIQAAQEAKVAAQGANVAPTPPAINPGRALFQSLKEGQKGAISPKLLARLGLGTAGALAGGTMTPEDPLAGAVMGGVAGAALPSLPGIVKGLTQLGAKPEALANLETQVQTSGGIKEAAKRIAESMPAIQRFNYLASPIGLPANALFGPYGSAYMSAIEHVLSGDSRGWQVLREMTPMAFAKEYPKAFDEAASLIAHAQEGAAVGRAEVIGGKLGRQAEGYLALPGVAMTAGDVTARRFLERAGFSGDEARRITLTSEPFTRWGHGGASLKSWLWNMLFPFKRTPINIAEQGGLRTPGLGSLLQALPGAPPASVRTQLVRQGMGVGSALGAEQIGEHLTPEQARTYRRYLTNLGGQYSAPVAVGFTVGQARRAGRPMTQGLVRGAMNALPLPSGDPLLEWGRFLQAPRTAEVPRGAYPAVLRESIGPFLKWLKGQQPSEFNRLFPKVK